MIPYPEEVIDTYERRGWWGKKTLVDYIEDNAQKFPDRVAYVDSRQSINWAGVSRMVRRLAIALAELGIKKDQYVVTQVPNSIEFVLTHYALARLGAVTVPVVMPFRRHELDYILDLSEAVAAVLPLEYNRHNYLEMYKDLQNRHPQLKHLIIYGFGEVSGGPVSLQEMIDTAVEDQYPAGFLDQYKPEANDVVTMCLTSGTEAQIKGVPRTHNNWITFARVVPHDAWGRNSSDDVLVTPLPLPNLFGLGCGLYGSLMLGQKMVLLESFNPEESIRAIEAHRATHFMGVPAMHISMLNSPAMEEANLKSLTRVVTGGAPAPGVMIDQYLKRFGVGVVNGWGSNEGAFCGTRWDQRECLADSIGPHPPSYEIKIVDGDGNPLPPGRVGEIAMRGPCVFAGYHKRPDLNLRSFDGDGYFHTGDLGMLGFDGFYRFCGRKKDLIIRGGQNISAEEIEFLIQEHPRVLFVAAVGMPDQRLGERTCVYIQPKNPGDRLTLEEVTSFLKKKDIAAYKLPERVEMIDELPRTPTGKVQKFKLREDIMRSQQ